jgi:hypothetical protein
MRAGNRAQAGKRVVMTPEGGHDFPLLGYDVDADRVVKFAGRTDAHRTNPAAVAEQPRSGSDEEQSAP